MKDQSDLSSARLSVEAPGLLSTIQDRGRFGLRHLGVPWSGALVPGWQQLANALVGNEPDSSVIESFEGGLRLTTDRSPVRVAVMAAPDAKLRLQHDEQVSTIKSGRSHTLPARSTLTVITTGSFRLAVIAIRGLQVAEHLGSCSTYAKAGLGGLDGKALATGDQLSAMPAPAGLESVCEDPLLEHYQSGTLRVVMGPQDDHFSAEGLETFAGGEYVLSADADRMGARLSGPKLEHRDAAARDIVSDAIVPGSIQVPGNGQPIVLLNDAHTAGGYPKIATLISIDLALLGLQREGSRFRFEAISADCAIDAVRAQAEILQQAMKRITPIRDASISTATLLAHNLIDGVTDGQLP